MQKATTILLAGIGSLLLTVGTAAARHHPESEAPPAFSAADFSGSYAISFSGPIVSATAVTGEFGGTGFLTADGVSAITGGSETVTDGTNICKGSLSGSFTVNGDGTGTLTSTFTTTATIAGACPSSPVTHLSAIVLRSRNNIATSSSDAGQVVIGHLLKQKFPNPDDDDNRDN
jgi:hypothetical protein